ncbi:hypothetical protein CRM22_002596 [Opisthorchis felineus]|uniref:FAD-dependent oxidoreductase domain-containing protein 1 n=1 Tax=Opisthorchis felineus TaxID=147828 RepID=A0A4S2M553_OPIFE|nr:hypothetical protein CRM22_002596 [Opisthorchis felineus]
MIPILKHIFARDVTRRSFILSGGNASTRLSSATPNWDEFGSSEKRFREDQVPKQSDVVVIGGGLIGWSVAFWLRWNTKFGVTVVERDPTYARSASVLGLGSIRQQFSEPENIQMSLFSSEFLRNIKDYLSVLDDVQLDIEFNPQGCLLLADESQAETMQRNYQLQTELGAKVELLTKQALASRWPWLNVEDVELGCYGFENEGWFDPWLLLKALRAKCHTLGVNYVVGEVVDFEVNQQFTEVRFPDMPKRPPVYGRLPREAVIALPDRSTTSITFNIVVNAAGPWAADVARLAEMRTSGEVTVPLPVEPRLRHMYVVRPGRHPPPRPSPDPNSELDPQNLQPGLDAPFLIDPKRLFMERRGLSGEFIVYSDNPQWDSVQQSSTSETAQKLDVDYTFFKRELSKQLGHRVPSLASAEITSAWTAICDYNTVDQNLIIGHHPFYVNMFFCNGSSGHGAQHAIAIGRAVSELIIYGHYKSIDLTRFSFERLCLNEPVEETNAF